MAGKGALSWQKARFPEIERMQRNSNFTNGRPTGAEIVNRARDQFLPVLFLPGSERWNRGDLLDLSEHRFQSRTVAMICSNLRGLRSCQRIRICDSCHEELLAHADTPTMIGLTFQSGRTLSSNAPHRTVLP